MSDDVKRICVFAGSSAGIDPAYAEAARILGHAIAARRLGVVYGGARVGLMGIVANAALAGGAEVIGVIPAALVAREVAHDGLSDLRVVDSMHARKALMHDLSDAFIALPGGWGTLEELFEILTWGQLGLHRKPSGLLNAKGYFDGLLSFLDHATYEGFLKPEHRSMLVIASAPDTLLDALAKHTPPSVEKWIDRATR